MKLASTALDGIVGIFGVGGEIGAHQLEETEIGLFSTVERESVTYSLFIEVRVS